MVLLHYHVVPGLGDGITSRPEATAVEAANAAPADRGGDHTAAVPATQTLDAPASLGDTAQAA